MQGSLHSTSEKTDERTMDIIGRPLHTMPSGSIVGSRAKRTIVERQDISTRREQLIKADSQELSIIHTNHLQNRTRRKGKETVKPENESNRKFQQTEQEVEEVNLP